MERVMAWLRGSDETPSYWLTRALTLRGVGLIYTVAFFSLSQQLPALIGSNGLLPAESFVGRLDAHFGAGWFWELPSVFWLGISDGGLLAVTYIGLALSLALLAGVGNAVQMVCIWFLYMSLANVGQLFYGYGWEILLHETGFLAIFLCPLRDWRPLPRRSAPALPVIWMVRWLAFRVMFGAGLIKLRGDGCWVDLSCLVYHYETQPIPNPVSPVLHALPRAVHQLSVLWNHVVELVAPFMVLGPRRLRYIAGVLMITFQMALIVSGNLSFLNWLTIVVCIPCVDDQLLRRLLPARLRARLGVLHLDELPHDDTLVPLGQLWPSPPRRVIVCALMVLVGVLSINPVLNMLSPGQAMNRSFDPFHLVNTYGAFGSVGQVRNEVILQGTYDDPSDPGATWLDYEMPCKPGDPARRPCVISPYHYRLDWQIWFAAMSRADREPWLVHLVYKLLVGAPELEGLVDDSRFEDGPPTFIRAELYRYRFSDADDLWWERERVAEYLPPLSRNSPQLLKFLSRHGFVPP